MPAVVAELMRHNLLPHPDAVTANGALWAAIARAAEIKNDNVIKTVDNPLKTDAGFINLKGNLFDSAIMKTSVISAEFSGRYLSNPDDPNAFEGTAFVFDGPEDFHHKIDDESLEDGCPFHSCDARRRAKGLSRRRRGGEYAPYRYLIKQGVSELPCIGDGRQSGTSGSPSILNACQRPQMAGVWHCCVPETGCVSI